MLPEDEYRLKTNSQFENWQSYQTRVSNGFHHQAMRNMLQRNNRDGTFSDVGQMAGVERTDWSWSALIADFDLDGNKDIFVTNGIAKDLTSQDYVAYLGSEQTMRAVTSDGRARADFQPLLKAMTSTPLPNYAFHNLGNAGPGMRFVNEAKAWGLATPSFSNGAAYGDLNGDGALDLVVNNVNGEAFIYRNNARTLHPENHFLRVRLAGDSDKPLRRRRAGHRCMPVTECTCRRSSPLAASSRASTTCSTSGSDGTMSSIRFVWTGRTDARVR